MQARALVPPRLLDEDEVGRLRHGEYATGRGYRDHQLGTGRGQLFRDEDSERAADCERHHPELHPSERGDPHAGVVARPAGMLSCGTILQPVSNHVAIRIEEADARHRVVG